MKLNELIQVGRRGRSMGAAAIYRSSDGAGMSQQSAGSQQARKLMAEAATRALTPYEARRIISDCSADCGPWRAWRQTRECGEAVLCQKHRTPQRRRLQRCNSFDRWEHSGRAESRRLRTAGDGRTRGWQTRGNGREGRQV